MPLTDAEAYDRDGYMVVRELVSPNITHGILASVREQLASRPVRISQDTKFAPVLNRPAFDVYGPYYTPLKFLLWGLTPALRMVTGKNLAPSYNFFRIYREGDVCKVHSDRPACDHSVTLTLGYSDGVPWPLDIGADPCERPRPLADDFGEDRFRSIEMKPGDAVIYRGFSRRHGRVTPNPNRWSAHIFLHWVDLDGPHRECAFENEDLGSQVDFELV